MLGLRACTLVLLLFSCQVKFKANLALDESTDLAAQTSMSSSWPFTFGTDGDYTFNTSLLDFTGGVVRLTPADRVDDGNTASGFGGGTASGVAWDATNGYLRLTQATPTNASELDESWTPEWSNLGAYWQADNDWTDSKGNNDGAATNAPFTTSSRVGSHAGNFSNNGYVEVPDHASLNPGTEMTIAAWIYPTAIDEEDIIVEKYAQAADRQYILSVFTDGRLIHAWHTTGGSVWGTPSDNNVFSTGTVPLNTWSHVAVTRSGATVSFFINGVPAGSSAPADANPYWAGTQTLRIGGEGRGGANRYFNGRIDEIAVWTKALTAAQIQTLHSRQSAQYSGTFTSRVMDAYATGMSWTTLSWVPTLPFHKELPDYSGGSVQNETSTSYSSLVGSTGATGANDLMTGIEGLWHLNESAAGAGAADDFADDSGKGNPGEAGGGVTFGEFGKMGKAASFDGANTYVAIDGSGTLSGVTASSFSMAVWTKIRSYPPTACGANSSTCNGVILARDFATGIVVENTGKLIASVWNSGGTQFQLASTANTSLGTWHHVAMSVNDTAKELRLYVDGSEVAGSPMSYTGTLRNWAANDYYIGRTNPTDPLTDGNFAFPFDGWVDEAAIWSRALHANEVKQLYRRGANRIKYQVRICTAADCSDDATGANWKGPDGTRYSYFSELHNNSVALDYSGNVQKTLPSMLFSDFTTPVGTSRYFQYRTVLESDDTSTSCEYGSGATWCSPELKSVTVDPVHYPSTGATVVSDNGISFDSLDSFSETIGGGGCPAGIGYNLSLDKVTWHYWSGAAWVAANGTVAQSNAATDIDTNAATFGTQVGTGSVYIKAFLKSSGTQACELDAVSVTGTH